jgi:D-alanine-D-alanine ligase
MEQQDIPAHLRIGFAFDPPPGGSDAVSPDSIALEYEDAPTIEWLRRSLARFGQVIDLPWEPGVVERLVSLKPDIVFNITEANGSRNRESLIPAIAEALGIPCTGTDAVGLGMALDKAATKLIAAKAGVPTPRFARFRSLCQWRRAEAQLAELRFPLIVKPNSGGSSQGIRLSSKVHTLEETFREVRWVINQCHDEALVEEFIPGRELTAGLLFQGSLVPLPIAELVIDDGDPSTFYAVEMKSRHRKQIVFPDDIPQKSVEQIQRFARTAFCALGCSDFARVDFRLGLDGVPYFLEINPLPGLSPYYSVFPKQAAQAGIGPSEVVGQLVRNAAAKISRNAVGGNVHHA